MKKYFESRKSLHLFGSALFSVMLLILPGADPCTGQVAPPPVIQNQGLPDTIWLFLTETECRECHQADATTTVDRHHLLVEGPDLIIEDSVVPKRDADAVPGPDSHYRCMNCHGVSGTEGGWSVEAIRDCQFCHVSQTPHHRSVKAKAGLCDECHGLINPGLSDPTCIPTDAIDSWTPKPSNCVSDPNGFPACHAAGTTPEGLEVYTSMHTHHLTGLYGLHQQDIPVCSWCHQMTPGGGITAVDMEAPDAFRACENCHCMEVLHSIEGEINVQYTGHTTNEACRACHQERSPTATEAVSAMPYIDGMTPSSVWAEESIPLTLSGNAFMDVIPAPLESDVTVTDVSGASTTLEPTFVSESTIEVDLPATLAPGYYVVAAVKGGKRSNPVVLAITPSPYIDAVTCGAGGQTQITGSGFSSYHEAEDSGTKVTGKVVTVNPKNGKTSTVTEQAAILDWTQTSILAQFSDCPEPGSAVVHTVFTAVKSPGGAAACDDYSTKSACNDDPGCEWQGSPNNGQCVDSGGGCDPTTTDEIGLCGDGIDNDCDGSADCDDLDDCAADPVCQQSTDCTQYTDETSCKADSACRWRKKQQECIDS